jgi:general secretion pathway protein I
MVPLLANASPKAEHGFTLIEVLIALAIVGIAMTAVIKATSQNIRSVNYLQTKTTALWVGQQVLNQARVGLLKVDSSSTNQKLTTSLLGQDWYWQLDEEETPNPQIQKITVKVFANEMTKEEDTPLVTLESYSYDQKK